MKAIDEIDADLIRIDIELTQKGIAVGDFVLIKRKDRTSAITKEGKEVNLHHD